MLQGADRAVEGRRCERLHNTHDPESQLFRVRFWLVKARDTTQDQHETAAPNGSQRLQPDIVSLYSDNPSSLQVSRIAPGGRCRRREPGFQFLSIKQDALSINIWIQYPAPVHLAAVASTKASKGRPGRCAGPCSQVRR